MCSAGLLTLHAFLSSIAVLLIARMIHDSFPPLHSTCTRTCTKDAPPCPCMHKCAPTYGQSSPGYLCACEHGIARTRGGVGVPIGRTATPPQRVESLSRCLMSVDEFALRHLHTSTSTHVFFCCCRFCCCSCRRAIICTFPSRFSSACHQVRCAWLTSAALL